MRAKEKWAVDTDETTVHLVRHFLDDYNKEHGTSFKESDIHTYQWHEILGIPDEETYERYFAWTKSKVASYRPGAFYREFVEGAAEVMTVLSPYCDFYNVTDREPCLRAETELICSLLRNLDTDEPFFTMDRVFKTPELRMSKAEVCKSKGIAIIVDDSVRVAESCAAEGIEVFLLKRRWNERLVASIGDNHPYIHPVDGWYHLGNQALPRYR